MARILMPLPDSDFDVTETAVPWRLLTREGHEVIFATERGGKAPAGDALLLDGSLGKLGPAAEPRAFYDEMARSPEFQSPLAWSAIDPEQYDGMDSFQTFLSALGLKLTQSTGSVENYEIVSAQKPPPN